MSAREGTPAGVRTTTFVALTLVAFLLVSWSDEHYWDEVFYLYSARFHSPAELVRYEVVSRLFPSGFFSEKLGHVLILTGLTSIFPGGLTDLRIIQAVYTLCLLGSFVAAYACLRELFGPARARAAALVLVFSPLALYFSGKTLSEVPSLLFVTIGSWAFVRAFRPDSRSRPVAWLALAAVGVGVGTLCRITAIMTFGALGLALLAAGDARFDRKRVLIRLVLVGVAGVALQATAVALAGGSDLRFGSHVYNVVSTHPAAQHVYAAVMFVQAFALLLPFAWRARGDYDLRLGAIWLVVAALPFLAGHEPRYYAPAMLPFAIVAGAGLREAAIVCFKAPIRTGVVALLAGVVLIDRLFLVPLMPFEVQEEQLVRFADKLRTRYPGGTYVLAWSSDYSLLRYVFPDERFNLSMSRTPQSRYASSGPLGPITAPDRWWAGRDYYIGSASALATRPQPWLYIGWTYNPTALRIEKDLTRLRLQRPSGVGPLYHNHLAGSWVWYDSSLALVPADSLSQYFAYRIVQAKQSPPGPR